MKFKEVYVFLSNIILIEVFVNIWSLYQKLESSVGDAITLLVSNISTSQRESYETVFVFFNDSLSFVTNPVS